MKRDTSTIFIAVLLLVALFLGYLILKQLNPVSPKEESLNSREESKAILDTASAQARVLQWPLPNTPDEEKQPHTELIRSLAQTSQVLLITKDCVVSPVVLKIELGKSIVIQNQDSISHTLHHRSAEFNVTIPAGQEQTITANFSLGRGNYGYICDNKPGVVGILHVVSQ